MNGRPVAGTEPQRGKGTSTTAEPAVDTFDPARMQGVGGLLFMLRTQKLLLAVAAASSVLSVALGIVPFFCIAKMASAIIAAPPRLEAVRDLAFFALLAVALRYALSSLSNVTAHAAAFNLLRDLRVRLARKMARVPLSFFARHSTGALKRTTVDDVEQIEGFVAHHFPDAVAAFSVPVLVAVALFSVDWRMTLASLVMAPVAGGVMGLAMRGVEDLHREWLAKQDRTNGAVLEFLRGMPVIKTFGLTASSFGELSRSIADNIRWMERLMQRNGRAFAIFQALIGSSFLVLVPVGGLLYLDGSLAIDDLVLFLVLGPQLLASTTRLVFAWENVKKISEGNARIAALLLAPELKGARSEAVPRHDGVRFENVSFEYDGGVEVLHDVSFEAPAGRVTALVGPSGAGKTTLARLVPRLWDATAGCVSLGGVDVRDLPLDSLLARVSVVFQDVFLFHGSLRDNLLLARPGASDEELVAACRAARAHEFIAALPNGYDTLIGERGARLSGGEKQRLSIARAILKDAPVLILDEATAFTDPENEAAIHDAIADAARGRTVIVIAHRLSTVAAADHIVLLDRGRVVDQGVHAALLARTPLYAELWARHTRSASWELAVLPPDSARAAS